MGSILHITSQLNTERTYLHPQAVFHKIERGQPVPLGDPGEQRWAAPEAITVVESDEQRDGQAWPFPGSSTHVQARSRQAMDTAIR